MAAFRLLVLAALVLTVPVASRADEAVLHGCLNKEQQHAAIVAGQAVKLAAVMHVVRGRGAGEVIGARLCQGPRGLAYVLTLLGRDGKVTRATVDAANGTVIGRR
jgi:hypothetical protein